MKTVELRRVVITGVGAVTPVGNSAEEFWAALIQGKSGIGPITRFDASPLPTKIAGELKGFDPLRYMDKKDDRKFDPFLKYALACAAMAVEDAGLNVERVDRTRFGVLVGSGIGGITTLLESHKILLEKGPDRVSPFFIPMLIVNMASGLISMRFGAKGPNSSVVTACATGNHAIGDAMRIIQRGDADHMTAPDPEADGAARAMALAMRDAGIEPSAVGYINAHGTSSPYNEQSETMAIKRVFGEHARKLAVSSTKSMTGHLIGAAGGIEAIATALAIHHGILPPTINYETPDPDCDLDYVPNQARKQDVEVALSNAFGFGGTNATLAFKKYRA